MDRLYCGCPWWKVGKSGAPESFRRSLYTKDIEHMFLGQYEHTVDEKGRLTIPARYRELLENGAYITQGLEQNLLVLPAILFDQMRLKIAETSFTDLKARQLRRLIFSGAELLEIDRAGRILVPQFLRQAKHLDGAAVIVGAGEYFEIWPVAEWSEQQKELLDPLANQERFSGLNLSIQANG